MLVVLPALPGKGPNVIANVLVAPGDVVERGQELFSVETSKTTVPVKATVGGTVMQVLVSEGDEVATQDALAEIAETGAAAPADQAAPQAEKPQAKPDGNHAELLVIGGGTGGYVAALYAAKMGKSVTLVERDKLGGTCLNRGCIPTKALISSARLHNDILHAEEWGIEVDGEVHPRMDAIISRKDRVVAGLVGGIEYLMDDNGVRVLRGTARFEGDGAVSVAGEQELRLTYDDCIIATGSAIRQLNLPGADLPEVMNTDEALDCPQLPSSIAIVGGGVTGMEFAFMYRNLGVRVTVIARRPRLLHAFDEEASQAIMRSAADRGIQVQLNADVKGFSKQPDGTVRTAFTVAGEERFVSSERVLVAGGRAPVVDGVGLDAIGVVLDGASRAIRVDDRMRTNVKRVYAIGDVNGLVMLAHAASYQGRIAVDDILGRSGDFNRGIIPSVAYTDPEVATVGVGVDAARANAERYRIGTFSFAHNGKALAENGAEGFVSLVADDEGVLQGATIVGKHASELIGYLGLAVSAGMPEADVRAAVFAHPTTSEAIHEAACDLTFGALHE